MKKFKYYIIFLVLSVGYIGSLYGMSKNPKNSQVAVFAGGCFWGVEAVFESLKGVSNVTSGYAGGTKETAKYKIVGTGRTNHAEVVEVIFNPEIIAYKELLEVFFTVVHDPTQLNYQGPDRGRQYRSAIFYNSMEQKNEASNFIDMLSKQGVYKKEIVTELTKLDEFYIAEDYHQNFLILNPGNPYIIRWDIPKLKHLQREFPNLIDKKMK